MIKRSKPTKSGREVYEMAADSGRAEALASAFLRLSGDLVPKSEKNDRPFEESLACGHSGAAQSANLFDLQARTWDAIDEDWRRIEYDWTQAAEALALNLDSHTNNTCLVLAFELVDSKDVLLFAADAQVGNWLSWQSCKWSVREDGTTREITAADLLARTMFYKVGHHGSHNATLRELGLELMTSDDLVAFIPVSEEQAKKNRWNAIPFPPLIARLQQKTGGRILRSDQPPPRKAALKELSQRARDRFLGSVKTGPSDLYFEMTYE